MLFRRPASACLIPIFFIAACSAPAYLPPSNDSVVYVIGRGWHTDIGLPVEEIAGPLAVLEAGLPDVRFVTFGFGERRFLVNRSTDFGSMLKALLPSRSALLTTLLKATPQAAFDQGNVVVLRVSRAGLARIQARIWRQFELSPMNEPLRLAEGPYPGSVFYAARDTYNAFNTCNTWTAETLQAGGVPIPAAGVVFADQVMGMVRTISLQQDQAPRL
jgi:uncharacterized protein (TIGR02117 family)